MARPRGPYVRGAGVRTAPPYQRRKKLYFCPMCGAQHLRYLDSHRFNWLEADETGPIIDHDERIEVTRVRDLPRLTG